MSDANIFRYDGYTHSSAMPFINVGQARLRRTDLWKALINERLAALPVAAQPVYIATGGGYGSFDHLVSAEKESGKIDSAIPSLKGDDFRHHPALSQEMEAVRAAIRRHLNPTHPEEAKAAEVEQLLSQFYSDEVNTKIVKGAVLRGIESKKSVIHESASIYPDTVERAKFAKAHGVKTVLIAGDCDVHQAMSHLRHITPFMTATSYQKFAARFEGELVPLFDEIRLYDTDHQPPRLIAEKSDADQPLHVHDPARYATFLKHAEINPDNYKTSVDEAHALAQQHMAHARGEPNAYPTIAPDAQLRAQGA